MNLIYINYAFGFVVLSRFKKVFYYTMRAKVNETTEFGSIPKLNLT